MKYLLDSCVLLWALGGNIKKLGKFADIIVNTDNIIYVSIASYWEIAIKQSLGKIQFDGELVSFIEQSGFELLSIETRHIDYVKQLPLIHSDPFDRLLIAQSRVDKMELLTADDKVKQYFDLAV